MAKADSSARWQRSLILMTTILVGVVVVTLLYWVQVVFIPLALAIFLTFLLSNPVRVLQRRGLGRVSSVSFVVLLTAVVLSSVGWIVGAQLTALVEDLPRHTKIMKDKVAALRKMTQGGMFEKLEAMGQEVFGAWTPKPQDEDGTATDSPAEKTLPTPRPPDRVVLTPESSAWLSRLPQKLTGLLEPLGQVALAIVLSIFMLLKREDLRNRFIRLVGHGRMTVTTKAVDDAGSRISRFLFMQVLINAGYGLAWGLGLRLIGIDYPILWGFIAFLARYIPYIGTLTAAVLPVTLSLVMYEGWTHVILVVTLLAVMELVTANVLEPWLFGQSIGVSEVALLLAAAFWAFLWGPIGLVLSGPLTVCLVVLGRYVPQLESFAVLLGDEPALEPHVAFYQRLLAGDQDEAEELAQAQMKTAPVEQVFDDLLLPALTFVRRDRDRQLVSAEDEQYVLSATREIVEYLQERQEVQAREDEASAGTDGVAKAPEKVVVLGWPARDEADRLALEMLGQTLDAERWDLEVLSGDMLVAQMLSSAVEKKPAIVCIGSLPPGGMAHTRYLCKRLRNRLPKVKIVVGRWGQKGNVESTLEELQAVGADLMETTLLATRNEMNAWLPVLDQETRNATAKSAAVAAAPA